MPDKFCQKFIRFLLPIKGLRSGSNLFPGSAANMSGIGATIQVLETSDTPTDEAAWHERIQETMRWFTEENLDMVALYFEQVHVYCMLSFDKKKCFDSTSKGQRIATTFLLNVGF